LKKKAIEMIPYLKLKKTSRKKDVRYIGVTAVKKVAEEKHFFLEIYKNTKNASTVPVARLVCTQKDFGTYFPERNEWTRQKCETDSYKGGLIWNEKTGERTTSDKLEKQNILYDEKDLERMRDFFKPSRSIWNEGRWWEYVSKHQQSVVSNARMATEKRKNERRRQALKEREQNTLKLPEQELLDMADERYFYHKHFLIYKKKGCFAKIACTKCGGVTDARWKGGESYESQFQRRTQEPVAGKSGTCPLCGAVGEYKCQGKVKSSYAKSIYIFLGQKYKETGMVLRYIQISKEWQIEEICENGGPELFNALEKLSGVEIARGYFEEGKPLQIDFHKHNPYDGKDFWDDCNLYGMNNIKISDAPVLYQTYTEMQGTIFQYSGLKEYVAAVGYVNPISYLERYQQTPQIEILTKLGLVDVVKELVRCRYGIVVSQYANRPDEFLGINKDKAKLLISRKGNIDILNVCKMEKRLEQHWTIDQIEALAEIGASQGNIAQVLELMTIQKVLNLISKYAGCEYGTNCSNAISRLKHVATTYFDYLSMRKQRGYDLRNTVYQRPKDLSVAHKKMTDEINKEQQDKRMQEAAEKYPMIRKNYRSLRNRYFYEDDRFTIRPARSAEEIIQEGRTLHHCVGGDSYLKSHNEKKSIILVMRYKDQQEIPYITVEIQDERIIQWYGAQDKKPDIKDNQKWLDTYIVRLKCKKDGMFEDAAESLLASAAG